MAPELIEGEDFYYDELGRMVFTEGYHLRRGYCCKCGCKHCPYGFTRANPATEPENSDSRE